MTALRGAHGPLPALLLGLTVVSGVLDVFSFVLLGHIFVANMTGNVVFLVLGLVNVGDVGWAPPLVAIATFAFGAFGSGIVVRRLGPHRGRVLMLGLVPEWLLFGAGLLAWFLIADDSVRQVVVIALLSAAMGIQNALARSLEVPDLTTTVLTLAITGLWVDAIGPRTRTRALAVVAILGGATVAGLLISFGFSAWVLPTAFAALTAVLIAAMPASRSDRPWTARNEP